MFKRTIKINKKDMDFEDQWKEQFYQSYLESVKQGRDKQPKAPLNILEALKRKLWK